MCLTHCRGAVLSPRRISRKLYSHSIQSSSNTYRMQSSYIYRNVRLKEVKKDLIVERIIGTQGLHKIYQMFNSSSSSRKLTLVTKIMTVGIRKLAGRLICELTYNCEQNQITFTEMFSFSPSNGKVCLN